MKIHDVRQRHDDVLADRELGCDTQGMAQLRLACSVLSAH